MILVIVFVLSLAYGGVEIAVTDLLSGGLSAEDQYIAFSIRLPRIVLAALVGCSLAVAGVVSQGLFRNPLASPSIIGTTSGASFFTALAFFAHLSQKTWIGLPLVATLGAFVATAVLLAFTHRLRGLSIETVLLLSFALNTLFGAATSLIVSLMYERQEQIQPLMYWLLGGLGGLGWNQVGMLLPFTLIGLIGARLVTKKLNVLAMGEDILVTSGLNPHHLNLKAIAIVAILVGGVVSVAGPISFVGLIIPHIARLLFGSEHTSLAKLSAIHGMSFVMAADLLARTLRAPYELQVGVVIAFIGAPFFVSLVFTQLKGRQR
jgi:iron complex transport system permease protein